jgi:hypothetical protein
MWRRLILTFLRLFILTLRRRNNKVENDKIYLFSDNPARYSSLPSCRTTDINELTLLNEPRDAFTATYLLRRLNSKYSK